MEQKKRVWAHAWTVPTTDRCQPRFPRLPRLLLSAYPEDLSRTKTGDWGLRPKLWAYWFSDHSKFTPWSLDCSCENQIKVELDVLRLTWWFYYHYNQTWIAEERHYRPGMGPYLRIPNMLKHGQRLSMGKQRKERKRANSPAWEIGPWVYLLIFLEFPIFLFYSLIELGWCCYLAFFDFLVNCFFQRSKKLICSFLEFFFQVLIKFSLWIHDFFLASLRMAAIMASERIVLNRAW